MSKITNKFRHTPYEAISPKRPELSTAGKTVLITGGGSGIGYACAEAFAQSGAANVVITGRTFNTLAEAKRTLSAIYPQTRFYAYSCNISSETDIAELFEKVKYVAPVDIMVANAGYAPPVQSMENMDMAEFRKGVEINLIGTYLCCQHYIRHVKSEKIERPTFIHISTGHAHAPPLAPLSGYGITKTAAAKVVDYLQYEEKGIRVFTIHPGAIQTNMTKGGGGSNAVKLSEVVELPAQFCVWLASDEAEFARGRFLWASWDVEELIAMKETFEKDGNFVKIGLKFPGSRL